MSKYLCLKITSRSLVLVGSLTSVKLQLRVMTTNYGQQVDQGKIKKNINRSISPIRDYRSE